MNFAVCGQVTLSGEPIYDITVSLELPKSRSAKGAYLQRTNRDGLFRFNIEKMPSKGSTIRVLEGLDQIASFDVEFHGSTSMIKAEIDPKALAKNSPLRLDRPKTLMPKHVRTRIETAVLSVAGELEARKYRALAAAALAAAPPIGKLPNVLGVARGVLVGRPGDLLMFRRYLRTFENWSRSRGGAPPDLSIKEAETILGREYLDNVENKPRPSERQRIVKERQARILVRAAFVAAGGDARTIHRYLDVISQQLEGFGKLDTLFQAADSLLQNTNAIGNQQFLDELILQGNVPGPDDGWGGGSVWPPKEDRPRLPDWATIERIRDILQHQPSFYQIDSITPGTACSGDIVTITGSGFGDTSFAVLFAGPNGTQIPAEPSCWKDDEITVIVPAGAQAGHVRLDIVSVQEAFDLMGMKLPRLPTLPLDGYRFEGGTTRIDRFASSVGVGGAATGEQIVLWWESDNADSAFLQISEKYGGLFLARTQFAGSDEYRFAAPSRQRETLLTATLEITGPCGGETHVLDICIRHDRDTFQAVQLLQQPFTNWHGNILRVGIPTGNPVDLNALVDVVRTAEQLDLRLGIRGNAWSFNECVVGVDTGAVVNTDALVGPIGDVIDSALLAEPRSILDPAALTRLGTTPSVGQRLVHYRAGSKLWNINRELDAAGLAMATLGGARGQSIAGAISTGTHGTNPHIPPIQDFVRAIHLVGAGGMQWWIEPARDPVTSSDAMHELRRTSAELGACTEIVYDDNLFDACLVSMGAAGVFYSVIIEAVDAHFLESTSFRQTWQQTRLFVENLMLSPTAATPWFAEVVVTADRQSWLTTRNVVEGCDETEEPADSVDAGQAILAFLSGLTPEEAVALGIVSAPVAIPAGVGIIGILFGALATYVVRKSLAPWEWLDSRDEIQLVQDFEAVINDMQMLLRDQSEQALANALPDLINLLWRIGFYFVEGRQIVDLIVSILASEGRPEGTTCGSSFSIMTGQDVDAPAQPDDQDTPFNEEEARGPIIRKVESAEYIVRSDQFILFIESILALSDSIRNDTAPGPAGRAFALTMNLRVTRSTRALLGMQQFEPSCYVELWTIEGLRGNAAFRTGVEQLAAQFNAIPHWGMFHDNNADFPALFATGNRFARWQAAMNRIATAADPNDRNTFRHQFLLDRNLLDNL